MTEPSKADRDLAERVAQEQALSTGRQWAQEDIEDLAQHLRADRELRYFLLSWRPELLAVLRRRAAVRADLVGEPSDQVALLIEVDGVKPWTVAWVEATMGTGHDVKNLTGLDIRVGGIDDENVADMPRVAVLERGEDFDAVAQLVRLHEEVEPLFYDHGLRLVGLELHGEEMRATGEVVWLNGELRLKAWRDGSGDWPPADGSVRNLERRLAQMLGVWATVEVID